MHHFLLLSVAKIFQSDTTAQRALGQPCEWLSPGNVAGVAFVVATIAIVDLNYGYSVVGVRIGGQRLFTVPVNPIKTKVRRIAR
jgi:hypothetical protein